MKCPKGTAEQIQANLTYLKNLEAESCETFEIGPDNVKVCKPPEESIEELAAPEEADYISVYELDEVRADKRCPPNTEDEITYLFVNHFLDVLLKSWDGTPCRKPKLATIPAFPSHHSGRGNAGDFQEEGEHGEDESDSDSSCDSSLFSVSADRLSEVYKTRSQKLSKNTFQEGPSYTSSRLSGKCGRVCEGKNASVEADEYDGEDDEEKTSESEFSWKKVSPDEEVYMTFQNGAWYNGRVSRRLMDGEGTFFWEDGGSFQGGFIAGAATGFGRLEFPNQSVYEGGVHKGFRHGEGLQCMPDSPLMYSGEWWLGKKNGHGVLFYDDPVRCPNFYKGYWVDGLKEGFGYRQYPSGSKYVGYWQNGKRHGTGIMFWCNHDIYRGEWKDGLMDGFGEYIWSGFINKSLSYPRMNTYRGFWSKGKRNGVGLLELTNGSFIETVWVENEKNGPGAVICPNGTLIAGGHKLFKNDRPALLNEEEDDLLGLLLRSHGFQINRKKSSRKEIAKFPDESQLLAFMSSMEKAKAISIPIHMPVHSLDLSCHVKRLQDQKNEFFRKQTEQISIFSVKNTPRMESLNDLKPSASQDMNQSAEMFTKEEKLLRYSIMINLIRLKRCYEHWTTVACADKPPFSCVLLRLFFWELLTQAEVPRRNLSLIEIDEILGRECTFLVDSEHDPFERIQLWQFIHFLITISWYLYGQYVYADGVQSVHKNVDAFLENFYSQNEKVVLASAFNYFLQNHIFDVAGNSSDRKLLMNRDLVPLEAVYLSYKKIGEPHSAKQFLCAVFHEGEKLYSPLDNSRYYETLPDCKMRGQNAFTFTNELSYLPSDDLFNAPEVFSVHAEPEGNSKSELSCFSTLGPTGVVKCLVQVCPNIMEDDLIVDMEYQLTFLEFYKAIIACAEMSLKQKALKEIQSEILSNYKKELDEYDRLLKDYERQKEATVAVTKKVSNMKKPKK